MRWSKILGLGFLPALVNAVASTDDLQDADPPQSGYLPGHNLSPNSVASSKFVLSWKVLYNTNEVFYAKPLVYTNTAYHPNEMVITVSNQNIIRLIDGLTGALVNSRTLDPPFQSVDSNCGDIPNTVGITGTPLIDSTTDIMYFYSKGYKGAVVGPAGTINGQYKFYAVHLPTLADVSGFPVIIDGHHANNDPTRYFIGGTVLNKLGLAEIGNAVVGGFGGHCDNFNYTGMLVAVSKTSGVGVTNIQAMEAMPGAPSPQALDITVQNGGKAGIWHSGMGIAADTTNNRVFFATGNSRGGNGDNSGGAPASGKIPISTLQQAVCDFAVDPNTGSLTQKDYFEPFEYGTLNGGDLDLGSSGVCLLDPTVFSGTGVNRIAIAGGKSKKVYVMNADNLGGFAMGPGGSDAVLQTILNGNSMLSGCGSYPLEGGYFYINPTVDYLYAYKMGRDNNGVPIFTLAGKSAITLVGKSVPTVTSLNGEPGTGIVWVADINNGLQAFNAVPVNGVLTQINVPATGRLTKYLRPGFGNGRVYVSNQQTLIAVGGPAATGGSSPPTSSSKSSSSKTTSSSSSRYSTTTTKSSKSTTRSSTSSSKIPSSSTTSTTSSSKPTTSSSKSSSKSSTSSSKSSTTSTKSSASSKSSTTTNGPSKNIASTTTTSSTTFVTSVTNTAKATSAYEYVGCFSDTSTGHAMPILFADDSMTPELCIAHAKSLANAPTPTIIPYVYVEYHRECYGGSSFTFGGSAVTSLTGHLACTDVCGGSIGAASTGTAMCGGPKQFNLYATGGAVSFPSQPITQSV